MDDFDRKWQRIQDQLGAQIRGDAPTRVSSGRTLFGIQSGVEAKMDEIAKEMEAEAAERRRRQRELERTQREELEGEQSELEHTKHEVFENNELTDVEQD